MRVSAAASEVQLTCAGCNFEDPDRRGKENIPIKCAAVASAFLSYLQILFLARLFLRRDAWKYVNRPADQASRLIMPESTDGGSLLVTIPGQQIVAELARHQSIGALAGYQYCSREGRAASTASQCGACHFSPRIPGNRHRSPVQRCCPWDGARSPGSRLSRGLLGKNFGSLLQPHLLQGAVSESDRKVTSAKPKSTAARQTTAARGRKPAVSPDAATSCGEGVSPAASAAANGSPPAGPPPR